MKVTDRPQAFKDTRALDSLQAGFTARWPRGNRLQRLEVDKAQIPGLQEVM